MKGLYIHIPFCEKKCSYCDFASYAGKLDQARAYIDAVADEARLYEGERVSTVFIGGGTPSCLPLGELERLVKSVKKYIDFSQVFEFSIEANPNSFSHQKAEEYVKVGANRVSLGLQSSSPSLLKLLGRLHSSEDFSRAVGYAFEAGISNINADMMYSLPGQTLDDVKDTLNFMLDHPVTHVSAYSLILEEGTPLFESHPVLPDEDTDREMFYLIKNVLEKQGFHRYEISNFALSGKECAHNLIYWRVCDYIGLGAAAHSCYKGIRFSNPPDIADYIAGSRRLDAEQQELIKEKIMLGLRLCEGIDSSLLPRSAEAATLIRRMRVGGLCRCSCGRIALTDAGMDIQNEILTQIFNLMCTSS